MGGGEACYSRLSLSEARFDSTFYYKITALIAIVFGGRITDVLSFEWYETVASVQRSYCHGFRRSLPFIGYA